MNGVFTKMIKSRERFYFTVKPYFDYESMNKPFV